MAEPDNTANPSEQSEPRTVTVTTQPGFTPPRFADVENDLKKTHAETAKRLSYWLVGILAGTVVLHYGCVMTLVLLRRDYGVSLIEDVLHAWLPVLAGLAGSAATYYFTRESK